MDSSVFADAESPDSDPSSPFRRSRSCRDARPVIKHDGGRKCRRLLQHPPPAPPGAPPAEPSSVAPWPGWLARGSGHRLRPEKEGEGRGPAPRLDIKSRDSQVSHMSMEHRLPCTLPSGGGGVGREAKSCWGLNTIPSVHPVEEIEASVNRYPPWPSARGAPPLASKPAPRSPSQ